MTTGRIPSVEGGIQPTIIDAAGDLIYGAGNDTPARLAIGTAGQVLQVNSGATAPEWVTPASGGGLVQLSTGSLSGTTTTISSISGSYKDLKLVIRNYQPATTNTLRIRLNGDTGTNYATFESTATAFQYTHIDTSFGPGSDGPSSTGLSLYNIDLYDYANTVTNKMLLMQGLTEGTDYSLGLRRGSWKATAAIDSITMFTAAASMTGTYILYGVQ
jgi:hypothetical protein